MKNKTIKTIILATTLSLVGVSYAIAGNHQGMKNNQNCENNSGYMEKGHHHGKKHVNKQGQKHGKYDQKMEFSQLQLSAEQKQQIDAIMAAAKADNQKSMLAHRASMQTLMNKDVFDTEAAKALLSQKEVQKAEKRLTMMKAKHQAFQLLTDEQKTKFIEIKANRQNR